MLVLVVVVKVVRVVVVREVVVVGGDGRLLTCTGRVGGVEARHGGGHRGGHARRGRRPRGRQRAGRVPRHAAVEDLSEVGGSLQD